MALHGALPDASNDCTVIRSALPVLVTRLAIRASKAPELAFLIMSSTPAIVANLSLALDVPRALRAEWYAEALLQRVDGAQGALPFFADLAFTIPVLDTGLTFLAQHGRLRACGSEEFREALFLGRNAVLDALFLTWRTPALVGATNQPRVTARAFRAVANRDARLRQRTHTFTFVAHPALTLGVVVARFAQTLVDCRRSEGEIDHCILFWLCN